MWLTIATTKYSSENKKEILDQGGSGFDFTHLGFTSQGLALGSQLQQNCSEIPHKSLPRRGIEDLRNLSRLSLPLPHPALDLFSILVAGKKQLLSLLREA